MCLRTEIPNYVENKYTKVELEQFCVNTISQKTQIKLIIKLAKITDNLHSKGKISSEINKMRNALAEISNIANSSSAKRTPRQILRFYNQSFLFGALAKTIIGTPSKTTAWKF